MPDCLLSHLCVSPAHTVLGLGQDLLVTAVDHFSSTVVIVRGRPRANAGLLPVFIPAHVSAAEGLETVQTFPLAFPIRPQKLRACFVLPSGLAVLDSSLEELQIHLDW